MKPAVETAQLFNSLQLSYVSSAAPWPAGVTSWPGGGGRASSTWHVTACGVIYITSTVCICCESDCSPSPDLWWCNRVNWGQLSAPWCLCRPLMSEYISRQQKSCSVLLSDENFFFFFSSQSLLFHSLSILSEQIHDEYHDFMKVIKSLITVTSQRNHKTN